MSGNIIKSYIPRLGFFGRSVAWILTFFILIMIVIQLLLMSGIVWLNSEKGEAWLKNKMSAALKGSPYSVEFSGLHYSPLSSIVLDELSISEGSNPLLTGEGIRLHIGLLEMATQSLSLSLNASEITLYKNAEGKGEPLSIKPFSLPDLYFTRVSITEIAIKKLTVNVKDKGAVVLSPSTRGYIAFEDQKIAGEFSFKHGMPPQDFIPDGAAFKMVFDPQAAKLSLDDISFKAQRYQVSGHGTAIFRDDGNIDFVLLGIYDDEDVGSGDVTLQVTGTQDKLGADIKGNGEISALMDNGVGVINFKAHADNILKDIEADIELQSSYKDEAATFKSTLSIADQKITLSNVQLNSSVIKLSGDLDYGPETTILNAKIKTLLDKKNISLNVSSKINANRKVAEDITGAISIDKANLNVSGRIGVTEMALSIKAKDMVLQNLPLSLPAGHELSGKLSLNMMVIGAPAKLEITGDINLTQGRYAHKQLGVELRDITAQAQMKDNKIHLINLRARDAGKGTLEASGAASLDMSKPDGNLSLKAKNIHLLNSNKADGLINAVINVVPTDAGLMVSGTIVPEAITIKIPEGGHSKIPSLNIYKKGQKTEESPEFLKSVSLDLKVDAPKQIFVRGWGLDAEFGGKLKISGTASEPDFQGSMESIRGRYEEFGKRFALKKASLRFAGSVPPYPYLDIIAETKTDTVMAQILITGSVQSPEIDFTSEPVLPRDEVLVRILFGKDMSKITPFQAIQLAQTLARFTGKGGGVSAFDPLGTVRGITGLDDLRVETDAAGAASVGAGKYLSEKVYLEFETGAGEGSSGANVQIELTPSIRIESEIGQDAKGGAGLFWNHDY